MFDISVALYKVQAYGSDQIITPSNKVENGEEMAHKDLARYFMRN